MDRTSPDNPLSRCRALSEIQGSVLDRVLECCKERTFEANERLIRQGDAGDALWMLIEGSAEARLEDVEKPGLRRSVGEFGPYAIVGEMALLTGEPRTADVIATSPGRALILRSEDFQELATSNPELSVVLTHLVADRLGQQSRDGMGGKVVGRYRIRRCIGRGGMAIVYEANELESDETVALKMMSHRLIYEKGAMARFEREAEILFSLDHPNIVRVSRLFSAYKTAFLAMDYCDGADLGILIKNGLRPDEMEVRKIIGQLATGLRYLHAQGVVHRDLKPQNVLVSRDGRLELTDFGIARLETTTPGTGDLTVPGQFMGTPHYMAPEQFDGAVASPQSDLYSLGCLLLEILTGLPPFDGRTVFEILEKKRKLALPPRSQLGPQGVSRKVYALLESCLSPDIGKRGSMLEKFIGFDAPVTMSAEMFADANELGPGPSAQGGDSGDQAPRRSG